MSTMFWQIMAFYAILSCFIMPAIGYYFMGTKGLSNGYVVGTIVSMILWFTFGKKMAKV
jgi:hypothetical protein